MLKQILPAASRLDKLPVPKDLIAEVEAQMRREMLPLAHDDLKWLQKIHATKDCQLEQLSDLDRLAQFFDGNRVQCYRNGQDWYDVHPLLRAVIIRKSETQDSASP